MMMKPQEKRARHLNTLRITLSVAFSAVPCATWRPALLNCVYVSNQPANVYGVAR